ncbi:glycosyl hydrolase [Paenibacillus sp. JMULE4]|nr:glycosyl hydrolase [Paenibacillus sp. JMULE4]NTZ20729.1 glycosyl hydrolase [Paenibacillus sp. JMULE4]
MQNVYLSEWIWKEICFVMRFLFIGSSVLFVLFLYFFFSFNTKAKQLSNAKKQEDREKRLQFAKKANSLKWAWIVALIGVLISGVFTLQSKGAKTITMPHLHGLGYSSDGQRIMIPSHDGLKVYSQGTWSEASGEKHDYMGFTTVSNGFYSSGHPAPGSNMKNPLGIVKSSDEGKSLEHLDLYGEVDFHLLNAAYNTHTLYVFNPEPNTRLKTAGLYYTMDETKTWTKSEMNGLTDEPVALAVHPTNDAIVAVGTKKALYLSKDSGNLFEKVADLQVTALSFNQQGALFIGAYKQNGELYEMDPATKQMKEITIPVLVEDAAAYVAQNPVNDKELVFATYKKDVYLSKDKGINWTKIADQGKGM